MQNTFCLPEFELFVGDSGDGGPVGDVRRLAGFIYRNLGSITEIRPTLDTHTSMQIFHPMFWVDEEGNHPPPYTSISTEDVLEGRWMVSPTISGRDLSVVGRDTEWSNLALGQDWLKGYAFHYVDRLKQTGKYSLTIWPYHAMLGSRGHALVSAIEEAIFFHGQVRTSPIRFEIKGNNPLTENYSVLRPEVLSGPKGESIAQPNRRLLEDILSFDMTIIAGEAKSHCVAWTVEDLLTEIVAVDPQMASKIYLLEDCTSPAVVPGLMDYSAQADEAFSRFESAGAHIVSSREPIESWPEVD